MTTPMKPNGKSVQKLLGRKWGTWGEFKHGPPRQPEERAMNRADVPGPIMLIAIKMAGESQSKVCHIYEAMPSLSGSGDFILDEIGRVDLQPVDFSKLRRS